VGLAMDATAAAAARGVAAGRVRWREVAAVALAFGGFQAAMPLLGWLAGDALGAGAAAWDHWIAFALLGGLGGKMLLDARRGGEAEEPGASGAPALSLHVLLLLAVATSIDALAAGVTLPALGVPIAPALLSIGVTTAALSGAGVLLGSRLGGAGSRLPALGGLVLVGLGVKILVEHLATGI